MKKIFTLVLLIGVFITFKVNISAEILDKTYTRDFTVKDDYIQVDEHKDLEVVQKNYYIPSGSQEVFTIFNPVQNDPDAKNKIKKTIDSIAINDNFGNKLNYTSDTSDNGNLQIKVNINTGIYYNQTYTINLSYKSYGLIIKSGNVRDVYVPGFAKDYVFEDSQSKETITTKINIPKSFGDINFTSPKVQVNEENSTWAISYTQDQLLGETGWIQIGTKQFYSFKITQAYSVSTNIPVANNVFKMVLPRDIKSGVITQKVSYQSFDPLPYSVETDKDGNVIATFKVPATESGNITVTGFAELDENNLINFTGPGKISDIPKDIIDNNTKPAQYWESDSTDIQKAANDLKGSETDVFKLVQKTYQFVVDKINYSEVKKFGLNERQGALATLKNGAGVCMEYSDLFIALMRAEGVPARAAFGTGYSALDYNTSSTNAVNHQWAEVYLPSINSWMAVDTTWGDSGHEVIGGDLNHFYSHVASADPNTPNTVVATLYGQNGNLAEREMKVIAISSIPEGSYQSEDDILNKYPKKQEVFAVIDNLTDSVKLFYTYINNQIDIGFKKIGISYTVGNVIKIIAVLLIVGLLFIVLRKRFKRKPL